MKIPRILFIILLIMTGITGFSNPLLQPFDGIRQAAPFDKIKETDYEPAFQEAMRLHNLEIEAIVNNPEPATFENTIVAMERSGELLSRIGGVFFNLLHAESTDGMMEISQRLSPLLSQHSNNISLNESLFKRIKTVYDQKKKLKLTPEQQMLLEKSYKGFVRNGANLQGEQRERYRKLTEELSLLTLTFGQNVLKETNLFEMVLKTDEELAGLPSFVLEGAKELAKEKGKEGYLFDLSYPSYVPFMKYSSRRDLREKLYRAYNGRCLSGEFDNTKIMKQIAELRTELANLLGYPTYADYALEERMAKTPDKVFDLLNQLAESYHPYAEKEVAEVVKYAEEIEGKPIQLMPWDWSYYADKLKDAKYTLNDGVLKPYFPLDKVKKGVFGLAEQLYGLQFKKNDQIPVYHPDVEVFEVFDKKGNFISLLYTDFYPRATKRSGAWMTEFKGQSKVDGKNIRPQVSIVMNFTKPTADAPALLTYDEVETLLHEFGHALHGMLAQGTYESLSGTNVYQDFVELPSQIMENWLSEKEFLDQFAAHYQTGEKIPTELVDKIKAAANYNAAYFCLRQLGFGYLDMAFHALTSPITKDAQTFERKALEKVQLLPLVDGAMIAPQFNHIFSGGYAAGYYSYKWAEVLDADAFALFKEKGLFNKQVADSFRQNILEKGGSEDPAVLYKRFRGSEPSIKALMKRDGVVR